jgi:hypothetical protein
LPNHCVSPRYSLHRERGPRRCSCHPRCGCGLELLGGSLRLPKVPTCSLLTPAHVVEDHWWCLLGHGHWRGFRSELRHRSSSVVRALYKHRGAAARLRSCLSPTARVVSFSHCSGLPASVGGPGDRSARGKEQERGTSRAAPCLVERPWHAHGARNLRSVIF